MKPLRMRGGRIFQATDSTGPPGAKNARCDFVTPIDRAVVFVMAAVRM